MDKRHLDREFGPAPRRRAAGTRSTSPFVGRVHELSHLGEALSLAAEGLGSMILLTGEPGIGKTRLAREALALANRRGFRVLEGRAYPLETGLAYAPFIDAFRPLLRSFDSARLAALVSGLPELGRLLSDLPLPPLSFPEALGDPALEKTRLFEAMLRLLERLAQETPVAFFLDDMQWADPATIDLLHHLVRGLADQPVLLLVAIGAHSLDTSLGLQALVVSLERDGLAEQMVVPRLEPELVDKLVRGILEGEPPGGLSTLLDARSGGRPLFVEALVGSLIDSGGLVVGDDGWRLDTEGAITLPPTVRRLILDRLGRLSVADRPVLDLIAVLGDGSPYDILRSASGKEEQALFQALRHLRAAGLVAEGMEGPDVVYNITHPLIQEVIYAELPEMERRHAHLAVIAAMESLLEGRPYDISRLAHHYHRAGREADFCRALTVLIAAGDRALSLYANEEAAQHYAAALAVLREGGGWRMEGGNGDASTLPRLLERLGEAWERIGKRGAAVEVWNEALVLLSEKKQPEDLPDERVGAVPRLCRQLAYAEC
ncbi:MAG: AAA family ATPase, partial [Dehalococcoidia bacterium]|nr:AAA family ATPase [Dehalococcoidia bacterium]